MKVHYIQPWRSDKNIGRANNEAIALLPDGDWICLTDGDSQWLLPNWGELVEKVITERGQEYALIGCVTNRLAGLHQCYNGEFSEDFNILEHYNIAKKLWDTHRTSVIETKSVAGMCMIFNKSTWEKTGKFRERSITADNEFNRQVAKIGGKICLAQGLYRFHSYRIWEAGKGRVIAHQSIKHLR
jgi:GT2 family glycosyltransferase